ncbi:cytochrome b/b6 domain-containing protein [Paraburkholderia unamae]|uniref:Cytochrome b/b6 domain-containing protein n=1 Tax=Paraburkholderia unamae TaxID=219649 RepID=A0ACC6RAH4_9BURK
MVQPGWVRITHWVNAIAVVLMVMSGWQIYDASPIFPAIQFPPSITLGGWLAGALQWHFAVMWLLVANFIVYLTRARQAYLVARRTARTAAGKPKGVHCRNACVAGDLPCAARCGRKGRRGAADVRVDLTSQHSRSTLETLRDWVPEYLTFASHPATDGSWANCSHSVTTHERPLRGNQWTIHKDRSVGHKPIRIAHTE